MLEQLRSMLSPYTIMAAFGAVAGFVVLNYNLAGQKATRAAFVKTNLAALLGFAAVLPFARLGLWVFFRGWQQGRGPFSGGISFYPGLLGFLAVAALCCLALRLPLGQSMNTMAPSVPLFHCFGRVGCFMGGCCYGAECDFTLFGAHFGHLPTQLFEAAFCLLLFFALEFGVKKHWLAVYLCAYAVFRFAIEFWRGDTRGALLPGVPLSPAQQIALLCLLGMGVWWAAGAARKRNGCMPPGRMWRSHAAPRPETILRRNEE